jgi:hypothetical protein
MAELPSLLPSESHLLLDASTLEHFLSEVEGAPPDWATVYGHGHHDPDHDDRLFNLNRERDARRDGKPALQWLITFAWAGELSRYDNLAGGFHVAMGPTFIPTSWGVVRFKAEDPPSNLVAVPEAPLRETLLAQLERHQPIDILVLMTGHLIPQESIVYDFSHEEEGVGLIMPVLRLEQLDYVMIR